MKTLYDVQNFSQSRSRLYINQILLPMPTFEVQMRSTKRLDFYRDQAELATLHTKTKDPEASI